MRNFNLSIYKQYYDQIKSGAKKFEYRKLDDYYTKKFIIPGEKPKARRYDTVTFYHKGDPPMVVEWKGLFLYPRKNPKWYAIRLGRIISDG